MPREVRRRRIARIGQGGAAVSYDLANAHLPAGVVRKLVWSYRILTPSQAHVP